MRQNIKQAIVKNPAALAFAWASVIFVLCATPGRYIPTASWLEILSFDKFVHAGIFFVLCSFLLLTVLKYGQGSGFIVLYISVAIAYGCLLEYMQANYFSQRSADWQDIVANSFGCLLSLLYFKKLRKFYTNNHL